MHNGIYSSNSPLTWVFDLDGVVYRGTERQPYAKESILYLRSVGDTVRFLTNKAAHSRDTYSDVLTSMEIPTTPDEVMTSGYATALYLAEHGARGKTVYRIGESGLDEELRAVGIIVAGNGDMPEARIDFVVVGMDRKFDYQKLARAQKAILEGARFIATNEDPTLPVEGGEVLPGAGCMVAAVRAATGMEPLVIGKPETYSVEKILESTNTPPERALVIGDRLDTDILAGNRAGTTTVLVLTGVTSREEAEAATGDLAPDRIIETLAELM